MKYSAIKLLFDLLKAPEAYAIYFKRIEMFCPSPNYLKPQFATPKSKKLSKPVRPNFSLTQIVTDVTR